MTFYYSTRTWNSQPQLTKETINLWKHLTDKKNWRWAGVRAIPVTEEDKKISKDQTHKMDMKNVKHFDQKDFMEAADYIGMFKFA